MDNLLLIAIFLLLRIIIRKITNSKNLTQFLIPTTAINKAIFYWLNIPSVATQETIIQTPNDLSAEHYVWSIQIQPLLMATSIAQ